MRASLQSCIRYVGRCIYWWSLRRSFPFERLATHYAPTALIGAFPSDQSRLGLARACDTAVARIEALIQRDFALRPQRRPDRPFILIIATHPGMERVCAMIPDAQDPQSLPEWQSVYAWRIGAVLMRGIPKQQDEGVALTALAIGALHQTRRIVPQAYSWATLAYAGTVVSRIRWDEPLPAHWARHAHQALVQGSAWPLAKLVRGTRPPDEDFARRAYLELAYTIAALALESRPSPLWDEFARSLRGAANVDELETALAARLNVTPENVTEAITAWLAARCAVQARPSR